MTLSDNIEDKAYYLGRKAIATMNNEIGNQALALYRTILSKNPRWPQAYLYSACIHDSFGRNSEAEDVLREGIQQVGANSFGSIPCLEELHLKLAKLHMEDFEYVEAIKQYELLLQAFPRSRRGHEGLERAERKKRELEHILKLANPTFPLLL